VANIDRLVVTWSGFAGAPGYSVFYATPLNDVQVDISTFFDAITGLLPNDVTITIPNSGDTLNDATGALVGSWTATSGVQHVGENPGLFAGPAGACVSWQTGGIVRGRRVKGRTFIVPLAGGCYDTDGTLEAANRSTLETAADALVASAGGNLLVWSRPVAGNGGSSHPVTGASVADRVAVLRSRRS
jgi:hypothetical protein